MQDNKNRITIVDTLRGWALFGVTICNGTGFAYSDKGTLHGHETVNTILGTIEGYVFSAKAWTMLCILFGFGFGFLLEKNQGQYSVSFVKRMLVLLCFAFVNTLIYEGDILRDYAVLGLLLVLFYRLSPKQLFIISATMFVLLPFFSAFIKTIDSTFLQEQYQNIVPLKYSHNLFTLFKYELLASYYSEVIGPFYLYTVHYIMFFCMLLGLAAQKSKFFERLPTQVKTLKIVAITALVFTIGGMLILNYSTAQKAAYLHYFKPGYWFVISTMIFTMSSICLLFVYGKCKRVFGYFAVIGHMTLTNYMMQNVIAFFVFKGIGLRIFDSMPYYFYFLYAIGIYTLQVIFSTWWLKTHQYGPMEWLWRSLSGTKSKPLQVVPQEV
jgi:uncharacterized protein